MTEKAVPPGPIGVVLAGGGARGAYEAGVLAELLPALEKAGQRPTVFVGTSAGAINATLFASLAHLPATEAAELALDVWRRVGRENVIQPILPSGIKAGLHYITQLFGAGSAPLGVLDASPLATTLDNWMDWEQLHRNTAKGVVVAVTATACNSGRSVVFVEGAGSGLPPCDENRALDYVDAVLNTQHVMASAAIPVVFSARRVDSPADYQGWYFDGGIRLNAPVKPAVSLGVGRVIVIAGDPLTHPTPPTGAVGPQPDIYAAVAEMLQAALVDRMIEDMRTLGKINEILGRYAGAVQSPSSARLHRLIPHLFVGPGNPGSLARLANHVIEADFGGGKWLLNGVDYPLLHHLFGGTGKIRGELLSYLFFEHRFIEAAIKMGQRDARHALGGGGEVPWRLSCEQNRVIVSELPLTKGF